MHEITMKARAKINITLDVLKKREDGYHDVKMIMQTINIHDKINIKKTKKQGISFRTNLKWLPTDEKNLAYKAAKIVIDKYNIKTGIEINLYKVIPVAAGLAGGSSDAAAVLVGMNKLFGLHLSKQRLMELGQKLGADVPYCIMRGTVLAEGIGEKLTKLPPMPKCYVVLAKPNIRVSTPWVYRNLKVNEIKEHPDTDQVINFIQKNNLYGIAENMKNVLEIVTVKKHPIIQDIKDFMINNGALNSLMSGSGPTVFGLFDDRLKAKKTVYDLKMKDVGKDIFSTYIFNTYEEDGYVR